MKEIRYNNKSVKRFLPLSFYFLIISSCLVQKVDFLNEIEEQRVKNESIIVMYIYDPIISNQCEIGMINSENVVILPKHDFFKDSIYYVGIELKEDIDLLQSIHETPYLEENEVVGCNGCAYYVVVKYSKNSIDTLLNGYR